jgi:hypothetical protein
LVLFLTPLQFVHLFCNMSQVYPAVLLMYHHHISVMQLGHLLTLSGLTYTQVSSKFYHDSFC